MALIPPIVFGSIGIDNSLGIIPHLLGSLIGLILYVYALCEEYGWRGYLEDELQDVNKIVRIIVIGGLWFAWHLTFLKTLDVFTNLEFRGIILTGTWGLGAVIQSTQSIMSTASFHMIYNTLILDLGTDVILLPKTKFVIIGICIFLWAVIIKKWEADKISNEEKDILNGHIYLNSRYQQ